MSSKHYAAPRHLVLTGEKGVGKSTLLARLLRDKDVEIGGFVTMRVRVGEGDAAVYMFPYPGSEVRSLDDRVFTKKNGVIKPDDGAFDRIGCGILEASRGCGVIVMDELGPAEESALAFQEAVLAQLDGAVPVYCVVQRAESGFLNRVKSHEGVCVVRVTRENCDALYDTLREARW